MNCSKPERPIRALWPAAVALAIMFLASFFALWPANQSACNLLFYFLSGLALYLLMQRGIRHKIYAAGILLWATLLNTYITAISRIMQMTLQYMPARALVALFGERKFLHCLIFSAVVLAIGLVMPLLFRQGGKKRILCAGAVGAGAVMLYAFLRGGAGTSYMGMFEIPFYDVFIVAVIPALISAAAMFLSLFAVWMFCNPKSRKIRTGIGHKVWFSLCVAFSTIGLVWRIVIEMQSRDNSFALSVLTAVGIFGYILLLASRRSGYLLILMAVGIMFFSDFQMNLNSFIRPLVFSGRVNTAALGGMAFSLTMLVNPAITGITLLGVWKIDPEDNMPIQPVATGASIGAIDKIDKIGATEMPQPSLHGLRCPSCGSGGYRAIGERGGTASAVGITLAFGAIGNMVKSHSASQNMEPPPIQYRCDACKNKFTSLPLRAQPDELLPVACTVTFLRLPGFVGSLIANIVYLNGVKIGPVKNGQTIAFATHIRHNVIYVTDPHGVAFKGMYRFEAQPGGNVHVRFKRKFLTAPQPQGGF